MEEHLQQEPAAKKSITRTFIVVIVLSFSASLFVASLLVSPSVDHAIAALQQTNSHAEANLSAKLLEQYIQDRVQVLRDIAKYPVLKNAVMETGISQADLNDFLSNINLVGNTEDLAVLNISASPLYDRHKTPKEYSAEDAWFIRLLAGTSDQEINLINTGANTYIQIAVPINLGGYPEGVLVSEIQLSLEDYFSKLLLTSHRKITLSKDGVQISTSQNIDFNDAVTITEHLPHSNIELNYRLSAPQLKQEKFDAILKIMLSVLLSMIAAFSLLYVTGRQALLNPYKKLQSSQEKLKIAKELAESNAADARKSAVKLVHEQEALKISEVRFQLAVEGSNDGIWEWNILANETYLSPRLRELLGYEGNDTTHLPNDWSIWKQRYHPDDAEASNRALRDHIENSTPYDIEFRLQHKDGTYRFFRSRGNALRNENGEATRMAGSITDITSKILQKKDLEKARTEAENANQAKSEFLASMSHEIRTPMNGVIGMLAILEKSKLDQEQRRQLNIAKSSASSLLNVINDILDFSKIDARKLSLESIDFSPIKLFGDFSDGMALRVTEKNLELVLDLREVPADFVKGDPSRIRQVLTNLVGNAIKFTDQGEITLKASITTTDNDQCRLHCWVKDTGIGIPTDQQEQLFNPFTQADSSTTRKYGGTGLGLTICKHLCELMGGSISVTSTLGIGSEFYCDFLLEKSHRKQVSMPNISPYDARILVVDDNKTNCGVLSSQLQRWGANATEAYSADQAMQVLREALHTEHPFNLVLLDLQMPDVNGVELAKNIRLATEFEKLKLVLMISQPQPGDGRKYADLGIQAYFPKPVTMSDLLSAISILIDDGEAIKAAQPLLTQHFVNEFALSIESTEALRGLKLLVVEDNKVNQEVVRMVLADYGIQPAFAEHGVAALSCLQTQPSEALFQLVLMDCQMPIMDGFTATKAIRQGQAGDQNRAIPIIAMTANAMAGDRERCLNAGMNDYLSKPIDTTLLARTLLRWASSNSSISAIDEKINTEPAVDILKWEINTALKRVRGRPDRLATLLGMFQKSTPEIISKLREAIANNDRKNVNAHAHALKGTSGNLAFSQLYQACIVLEALPIDASPQELMTQLILIEAAYQDIQALIIDFLQNNEGISSEK